MSALDFGQDLLIILGFIIAYLASKLLFDYLDKKLEQERKERVAMEMKVLKAKKKPIVIEALYIPTESKIMETLEAIQKFAGNNNVAKIKDNNTLVISTLEGEMAVTVNDYIIKGVQGEIYPCKKDIFESTYDVVEK